MMTPEQVSMIAKVQRGMDSGNTKYVLNKGQRWAFPDDVFKELEIESGQTVDDFLLTAIMKWNISNLESLIAIDDAMGKDGQKRK